jgi:hypothetical protein
MTAFVLVALMAFAVLYSRLNAPGVVTKPPSVAVPPVAASSAALEADHEASSVAPAGAAAQSPAPQATNKAKSPPAAKEKQTSVAAATAPKKDKPADVPAIAPARSAPSAPAPAARADASKSADKSAAKTPDKSSPQGPVSIEFDKETYVAGESDGSVRLHVRRNGSTREPVRFRWTLRGNSAEAGVDFAAIGPDIEEIPAGAREATLTIPLVSDAIIENTELFLIEIESMTDGVTLGERSHAAVIIVDDD